MLPIISTKERGKNIIRYFLNPEWQWTYPQLKICIHSNFSGFQCQFELRILAPFVAINFRLRNRRSSILFLSPSRNASDSWPCIRKLNSAEEIIKVFAITHEIICILPPILVSHEECSIILSWCKAFFNFEFLNILVFQSPLDFSPELLSHLPIHSVAPHGFLILINLTGFPHIEISNPSIKPYACPLTRPVGLSASSFT